MLTRRERAASVYGRALSQGRGRILGAGNMVDVTEERLADVRRAARVIEAARDTDRYSMREPDDARLEQMLAEVGEVAAQLAADAPRWATLPKR